MQSMLIIIVLVLYVNVMAIIKRDREPSRVPVNMLKRLQEKQKNTKVCLKACT